MTVRPGGPSDNTTLTEVVDSYRSSGFASDFFAEAGSNVRCGRCSAVIDAHSLVMHSMRRLEGASDPDDMVAIVATSCPVCGADGTLILGFGAMASEEDSDVLATLRDHREDDILPAGASPDETPDTESELDREPNEGGA